uniref:transposase family protein n=1 Tax=Escherichia albertii TaxID=208962 RepID=UPI0011EF37C3
MCPACGQQSPVHDRRHRKWRRLDICQFMALFEADVPHVIWSNHCGYAATCRIQECAVAFVCCLRLLKTGGF